MCHPGLFLRWWPEFMLRPLWNLAHCRRSSMRDIARWLRSSCHWWHSSHCRFHETQPQSHSNLWRSWKQTRSIQLFVCRITKNEAIIFELIEFFSKSWLEVEAMIVSKIGTSYPFEVDGVKPIGFHHQSLQQTSANFDPVQKRPIPKRQGIFKRKHLCKTLCELRNCAVLGLRLLFCTNFLVSTSDSLV